MRKRNKTNKSQEHHIVDKLERERKSIFQQRKVTISIILLGIFFITLLFNSYFNFVSNEAYNPQGETLGTRYFLSGPDPYYNMRLCEKAMETGSIPYVPIDESDPMLNYPLGGRGFRPPLFNMIAVAVASFLELFMSSIDALGMAMLFLPAIYGALSVFPIYFIGKELLNWKVGLMSALLLPLSPIFIGSGHGSSLSLFDHDSFIFLLSCLLMCFVILGLRRRNIMYGALTGMVLTALYNTWTAAEFFFVVLIAFIVVIFIMNNLRNRKDMFVYRFFLLAAIISFVLSLPLEIIRGDIIDFPLFLIIATTSILFADYIRTRFSIPYTLFFPFIVIIGSLGTIMLYFVHLGMLDFLPPMFHSIAANLFGDGIYGSQISITIAEAKSYSLSYIVMSFGPVVYWLFLSGFVLFCYKLYKDKWSDFDIFIVVMTIIYMWLLATAGRFLNDFVFCIIIFAGYMITVLITKINIPQIVKNIKKVERIREITKIMKITQLVGVLFILFGVLVPNTYLSLDAAVPYRTKENFFGPNHDAAGGLYLGKSMYWADACYWLSQQDTDIENPEERPAVISWWDYGFYLSSMSEHPTVADNFQEGISAAANFKTSQTESEAISVLIIRVLSGQKQGPQDAPIIVGNIDEETKQVINTYLMDSASTFINILEDPITYTKTKGVLVAEEFDNTVYTVSWENAMYHELTQIITKNLSLSEIVNFYSDVQEVTGKSIRYYATEVYDKQIFSIFPFLASKGTYGFSTYDDDFYETRYRDSKTNTIYTKEQLDSKSDVEKKKMSLSPISYEKEPYYNSTWYKMFNGEMYTGKGTDEQRIPTLGLKHFFLDYYSGEVMIAQYYEGYNMEGFVYSNNGTYDGAVVYVYDKYGIAHDSDVIMNGQFSVALPAGNVSLGIFMDNYAVISKYYLDPITVREAKRIDVNTRPPVFFNIETATLSVNVTNMTGNESVNLSIVSKHFNTNISTQITQDDVFTFDAITSDVYDILLTNQTGASVYEKTVFVTSGNNTLDIALEEKNV